MKLWNKGYSIDALIENFTVGNDRIIDVKLAKYDIRASLAHAEMLQKIGILTAEELELIQKAFASIADEINSDSFSIEKEFEDIHSKIEFELIQRIGETGKKIHAARSRNDQVLVALHLYYKDEIENIKQLIKDLFDTLIALAEQYKSVLLPGYTHTQVAMPSSFGLWFSAYAEVLIDDVILLNAAYAIVNQNPLGSAAGYGSSFPIDREMTTKTLEFETLKYNSIAAQMSRGKTERALSATLASVAFTLSKLANDCILFSSQNFNFIKLPKEFTTGSSIMPHKQNPDVFELVRAYSNKIQSLPNEINMMTSNLMSGYHRDYQLLKEPMMQAIEQIQAALAIFTYVIKEVKVNTAVLDDSKYDTLFSVEAVNALVMQGMSFRDAYQKVGKDILESQFTPSKNLHHTHIGSVGNLALEDIVKKFIDHFSRNF